jgi:hypothetical protein
MYISLDIEYSLHYIMFDKVSITQTGQIASLRVQKLKLKMQNCGPWDSLRRMKTELITKG